jgi:hypothetical protein
MLSESMESEAAEIETPSQLTQPRMIKIWTILIISQCYISLGEHS